MLSLLPPVAPSEGMGANVGAAVCAAAEAGAGVEGLRERLIVLTSPSKCFNIASLDIAVAVVPHAPLFRKFRNAGRDSAEVRLLLAELRTARTAPQTVVLEAVYRYVPWFSVELDSLPLSYHRASPRPYPHRCASLSKQTSDSIAALSLILQARF